VRPEVFEFKTDEHGSLAVVALYGELDLATAGELQDELDRLFTQPLPRLVIDLSRLEFMDSTGLHLVMRLGGRCKRDGTRLDIVRGIPAVQELFLITGTDVQFRFIEWPEAAAPPADATA
jgi:anti-anti-sigma factor